MIQFFKKYFIPHKYNNHRPHLLRLKATLIILSMAILVEAYFLVQTFWVMPGNNFFTAAMQDAIIGFTNQYRSESGLNSLKTNPLLVKAAQFKAEDMAKNSYFNHTSPEGITPWHWLEQVGYRYSLAGENLAINFIDSQDTITAWMNSPTHRANILNNNFTEIGIGEAHGLYQGKETIFIVQFFGRTNQSAPKTLISQQSVEQTKPILSITEDSTESFIAVKGITQESITPAPITDQSNNNQTFRLKRWLTAPRTISNYFYFTILIIIVLALLLKIFVKIKIQHPTLIINGTILLIIISLLVLVNQYIALTQAKII